MAFFFIALSYAMVGFGGGSSYLALLAISGLPYRLIPPTGLFCNVVVTAGGVWHFFRGGHVRIQTVLPFIVLSVPMAYWGGRIAIGKELFALLLGASLLIVSFRMILSDRVLSKTREVSLRHLWMVGLPLGGAVGFLAGLVGIGGGIYLSPLMLFMGLVNPKEAAGAASVFIVVNSAAGLLGQFHKGLAAGVFLLPLGLAVLAGGQIGSRLGSYHVPKMGLQRVMAALIFLVSVKLILTGI